MRLAASLRYSLYCLVAVLLGSGAVWLGVRYLQIASADARGWSAVSMRVHGAAAMAVMVIVGSTASLHVARAWRERNNRVSGLALAATLAAIAITGYLLYYAGGEAPRALASALHWILGLGMPPLLAAHAMLGRRVR